jgi:hypothetical protein
MKTVYIGLMVLSGLLAGCASYDYAQNLKLVGFDENVQKGQSVGNIRGEDCTWSVLGYQLGGLPTVDRAFMSAKNQSGGSNLRYVNNVSTKNDGFDAGIVGKKCIVVTGVGYR